MKTLIAALGVIVLAGCATPAELRTTAVPVTQWGPSDARSRAHCIARLAKDRGYDASVLDGKTPGTYEITLGLGDLIGTIALIVISPALGNASDATFYISGDGKQTAESYRGRC